MGAVTIKSGARKDRWGKVTYARTRSADVLAAYPRRSDETDEHSVIVGYTVILEPGQEPPTAEDVVERGGLDYEVVGEPGVWEFFDGPAGIEVQLKRAVG